MTSTGDHDAAMSDTSQIRRPWDLDDAVIDAIVDGRPVAGELEPVVAFARQVRTAALDLPGPTPSAELARILRGDDTVTSQGRKSVQTRVAAAAGKVAGLGAAAKIALGATVAAASVTGAGALGALPASANHAVRDAIESVTPVHFDDGKSADHRQDDQGHQGKSDDDHGKAEGQGDQGNPEHPDNFGATVSKDATGESDGQKGVDGQVIRNENPGSEHRSDNAGDHTPSSTVPDHPQGNNGKPATTPSSTVPTLPDQANGHPNG